MAARTRKPLSILLAAVGVTAISAAVIIASSGHSQQSPNSRTIREQLRKEQARKSALTAERFAEQREADEAARKARRAEIDAQARALGYRTQPNPSGATIHNWAEVGDRLVKEGRYKEAYRAYMVRCESSEGSNSMRMAGCGAGRDLRLAAKARLIDTSDW